MQVNRTDSGRPAREALTGQHHLRARNRRLAGVSGLSPQARAQDGADQEAGDQELSPGRSAAAPVPAMEAMAREQLAAPRSREPEDVLQIRRRRCQRARHGGIERPARERQQHDGSDPRGDLEAAIADVLVWHPVPGQVQHEAERQRSAPRPDECATNGAGCDMKGDDHLIRRVPQLAAGERVRLPSGAIPALSQRAFSAISCSGSAPR
jgi:hypothetical protein